MVVDSSKCFLFSELRRVRCFVVLWVESSGEVRPGYFLGLYSMFRVVFGVPAALSRKRICL